MLPKDILTCKILAFASSKFILSISFSSYVLLELCILDLLNLGQLKLVRNGLQTYFRRNYQDASHEVDEKKISTNL